MPGQELCQSNCPSECHRAEPRYKQHKQGFPETPQNRHHPMGRGNPNSPGKAGERWVLQRGKSEQGEARRAGRF